MKYSFTLIVKPYNIDNVTLDSMRVIYNGNTCLVAKNSKYGGLYLHKCAKIIKGSFHNVAGSVRYPILIPKKEVHIQIDNFHSPPNIITDQIHEQDIISVIENPQIP